MFRRTLGAGVLIGGVALTPTSAAAQTTIGTFEGSVPIETAGGEGEATNRIVVEAQESGSVTIVFDDVVLSPDGNWERVEFGTTPYSLRDLIEARPATIRYGSDVVGTRQTFEVMLRVRGSDGLPRAGVVSYTFVPDSALAPAPGIRQGVAARVRLGEWPSDLEGIPAAIQLSEVRLSRNRGERSGFIDRLIPDIPGVINRGPGVVSARTTNVGDVLVQSETTLRLIRLPWVAAVPFVRPQGLTVITYVDRPRLLLPTESATSSVRSTASLVEGDEVDRLPFLGLVRITAEATGHLGASRDEARVSRTYLVAPWKEALVVLLAYCGVRLARRRAEGRRGPTADDSGGAVIPAGAAAAPSAETDVGTAAVDDRNGRSPTSGQEAPRLIDPSLAGFDDLQVRLEEIRARIGDQGSRR